MLAGLWALGIFSFVHARVNKWDFSHYYLSVAALRNGENPYTIDLAPMGTALGMQVDDINRGTYPPTFLLCFEPLTLMRPVPSYWTWFGLNVLALGLAFVLLLQNGRFDFAKEMTFVALAILYPPLLNHFKFGQSQIVVLLCLVLMMSSLRRDNQALAGILLAFASMLRVFPIMMVGYLVVERKWRALRWTAAGLATIGFLTLVLVGRSRSLSFISVFGFLTSRYWYDQPGNISINAAVFRIFWWAFGTSLSPALNLLRQGAGIAVEILLLAVTARVTNSRAQIQKGLDPRAFAQWVVATIVLAPTAWYHYLVLLYIPYALIASAAYAGKASRRAVWMVISSYAILWMDIAGTLSAVVPYSAPRFVILLLRERASVPLWMAYVATYWFVSDGSPQLWNSACDVQKPTSREGNLQLARS